MADDWRAKRNGRGTLRRVAAGAARWSTAVSQSVAAKGCSAAVAWRRALAELVFPSSCISCQEELPAGAAAVAELPFCRTCYADLELLAQPTCLRCGGPVPKLSRASEAGGCFRCRNSKFWFEQTIAAGIYTGLLRELVLRTKRAEGNSLSLAVGELVWRRCGERLNELRADVVVPIPLHWRRRLAHRTNSAALLAEVLSRRLRVPLAEGLLRRRRPTMRQSDVTPPQRWRNVRRAFSLGAGYHLRKAHVLVVDDILTTGATCSEAARALRGAGAEHVTAVVAARAIG